MPNSLMIVFSASEFDEMDEVCSIWQNCDCVSYKKFVVKYPSLKHCHSFLENVTANQMSFLFIELNFCPKNKESQIVKITSSVDKRIEKSRSRSFFKKSKACLLKILNLAP